MTTTFTRRLATAAITLSILAAPVAVLADTSTTTPPTNEIQMVKDQIKSLLDQLAGLTKHLGELTHKGSGDMASTTPSGVPCPVPPRNLGVGSHGDDVLALQKFLAQDSSLFPEGTMTGFFGPKTAEAVKRLQARHMASTTPNGKVGPMTRELLGKRCGEILGWGHMKDGHGSTTPNHMEGENQGGHGSDVQGGSH